MTKKSCFACNNSDVCVKVRELCKQMVWTLNQFDKSFLDHASTHCTNFAWLKVKKNKPIPHPKLF